METLENSHLADWEKSFAFFSFFRDMFRTSKSLISSVGTMESTSLPTHLIKFESVGPEVLLKTTHDYSF